MNQAQQLHTQLACHLPPLDPSCKHLECLPCHLPQTNPPSLDEGATQDPEPITAALPPSEPGPTSPSPVDTYFLSSDEVAVQDSEPVPVALPPSSKPGPTSPSPADTSFQSHQPTVFVNPL
jgi:hypothetical protein